MNLGRDDQYMLAVLSATKTGRGTRPFRHDLLKLAELVGVITLAPLDDGQDEEYEVTTTDGRTLVLRPTEVEPFIAGICASHHAAFGLPITGLAEIMDELLDQDRSVKASLARASSLSRESWRIQAERTRERQP
ncbi:hypothetical protein [Allonocardiopsis opalescens]|uniref:Uncharacterized protein n=1 Tax=Allonocardiopsis opalescens TaxID=1144618 RepID=A0A2T0Q582_9ACTN|nr:hypothetical protein [Allonocardiopsis opalescens]PRX98871.1 hypothetical protein CLV72_104451 [Allonocardiopsis opalescens]